MPKLNCPYCNKVSEFVDTGVGWKCPDCSGHVFTQYKDKDGVLHRYDDPDVRRKRMLEESHIYDMDSADMTVGDTEPSPFFSNTFAAYIGEEPLPLDQLKQVCSYCGATIQEGLESPVSHGMCEECQDKILKEHGLKLAELADTLDTKGLKEEANIIDQFLQMNRKKEVKNLPPNDMHEKSDLKFIPYDDIYSLSGEPLSNL